MLDLNYKTKFVDLFERNEGKLEGEIEREVKELFQEWKEKEGQENYCGQYEYKEDKIDKFEEDLFDNYLFEKFLDYEWKEKKYKKYWKDIEKEALKDQKNTIINDLLEKYKIKDIIDIEENKNNNEDKRNKEKKRKEGMQKVWRKKMNGSAIDIL